MDSATEEVEVEGEERPEVVAPLEEVFVEVQEVEASSMRREGQRPLSYVYGLSPLKDKSSGIIQEPHRHPGVFVARGKEDMLVTKNLTPGESVYGEKRVSVESGATSGLTNGDVAPATKTEYRVWNPFRSKV